ncbi:MAG: cytochrome c [Candidatus Promineifilaceae bacterium]|nr:cytochrome c [Candidatus Promineifilaceae bacterium]
MLNTAESTPQSTTDNASPPLLPADEIALGKNIYTIHCASCHGQKLEGEANWKQQNEDGSFRSPPHSADGHTWHHADSVLIEAIKEGGARYEGMDIGVTSNMPAFAGILTDEEITAVLTYIKDTWPQDIRWQQWQLTIQSDAQ